jgi:hypothetical protein
MTKFLLLLSSLLLVTGVYAHDGAGYAAAGVAALGVSYFLGGLLTILGNYGIIWIAQKYSKVLLFKDLFLYSNLPALVSIVVLGLITYRTMSLSFFLLLAILPIILWIGGIIYVYMK